MVWASAWGTSGRTEVKYLFIDGAYLRERTDAVGKDWFGEPLRLNFSNFGSRFTKTFYYDCLPVQAKNESEADFNARLADREEFFDRLRSIPGWHVSEGLAKWRKKSGTVQKEVDILIAVDMLTHTHRRNMHALAFIAGDQDFRPLVEAVVREGMYVTLWFEPSSISTELKHAADASHILDLRELWGQCEDDYRRRHPLPEGNFLSIGNPIDGVLAEEGLAEGAVVARLWRCGTAGEDWAIVSAQREGNHGFRQLRVTRDVDILKRTWAKDVGPCEWKARP